MQVSVSPGVNCKSEKKPSSVRKASSKGLDDDGDSGGSDSCESSDARSEEADKLEWRARRTVEKEVLLEEEEKEEGNVVFQHVSFSGTNSTDGRLIIGRTSRRLSWPNPSYLSCMIVRERRSLMTKSVCCHHSVSVHVARMVT